MLMIDKEPHVKRLIFAVIAFTTLLYSDGAAAQAQVPAPPPAPASTDKIDYSDAKTWLCRPGRQDACAIDLTTTVIAPDGKFTRETWAADPKAPIDCFYVYPTVSTDAGVNSDMTADPAELNVVATQFARFASKCRPFAPLYRQVTLAGLRAAMAKGAPALDRGIGYEDVVNAWNYYLQHDNQGRGVVLVGHSQGSFVLAELIRQEIDGKPVQSRLVSAILMGATLMVPKGKDTGGTFKNIPVCKSATQTGCVISFASFRSTIPPPANTLFGRAPVARSGRDLHEPRRARRRQRSAACVSDRGSPDDRRPGAADAVGHAREAGRDAVRQRAGAVDRAVQHKRERDIPGSHRPRQPVRSARRRHQRRSRRRSKHPGELGAAPDRRQSRDRQSGRRRWTGNENVPFEEVGCLATDAAGCFALTL